MAQDMWSLFNSELAKAERREGSEPDYWDHMLKVREAKQRADLYTDQDLKERNVSLTNLIDEIDTISGLDNLTKNELNTYENDAYSLGKGSNIVSHKTMQDKINDRRNAIVKYNGAMDQFESFRKSPTYLNEVDEWINLDSAYDKVNARLKADGKKQYGYPIEYIKDQFDEITRIEQAMRSGFEFDQQGNITKNNFKSIYDDNDMYMELQEHKKRLNIALTSLADNKINAEEAQAIIMAKPEEYETMRKDAKDNAKTAYKTNNAQALKYEYLKASVKKAEENGTPLTTDLLKQGALEESFDSANTETELSGLALMGMNNNYKGVYEFLDDKQELYTGRARQNSDTYYEWAGTRLYYPDTQIVDPGSHILKVKSGEENKNLILENIPELSGLPDPDKPVEVDDEEEMDFEPADPLAKVKKDDPDDPRASRNNNPGNLKFNQQIKSTGKDDDGFAKFGTADDGWNALYAQIDGAKRGTTPNYIRDDYTLSEFIHKYAPPENEQGEVINDTETYLSNLENWLDVDGSTKLKDINTKQLANAIARQEGYTGDFPESGVPAKTKLGVKGKMLTYQEGEQKGREKGDVVTRTPGAYWPMFKRHQENLRQIAVEKYNIKENKAKYKNIRSFVEKKFDEFLKQRGLHGKGYSKGDYIYFFPTDDKYGYREFKDTVWKGTTKPKGEGIINKIKGWGVKTKGLQKPILDKYDYEGGKITGAYADFARLFDEFREFLHTV